MQKAVHTTGWFDSEQVAAAETGTETMSCCHA